METAVIHEGGGGQGDGDGILKKGPCMYYGSDRTREPREDLNTAIVHHVTGGTSMQCNNGTRTRILKDTSGP